MKRSLAILAVTVVCGGTVAVTTAAYASDGDGDGNGSDESEGTMFGWLDGAGGTITSDDPGETFTCRIPEGLPRPDFKGFPDLPKLTDLPQLLYSEQAVRDRDSGEVTYQITQLGEVTESADGSLTVESADGTSWVWELTDDTMVYADGREAEASSLETGDRVLVHGTRDGDTRQADQVANPAPEIGLGTDIAPPERLREALPDDLGELLPRLKGCDDAPEKESSGTAA
jgi:hypothetical protein